MDSVLVCPKCLRPPLFFFGCRNCGSPKIVTARLIHHLACAHVDLVSKFETADKGVRCPKCLQKNLFVGSDFEFQTGPYECSDCGWKDMAREVVGNCQHCNMHFPMNVCKEGSVDVERLDALAHQQAL